MVVTPLPKGMVIFPFFSGQSMPQPPPKQMPPLGRMMVFVDGENLVCRYQEMLKNRTPRDEVEHEQDTFVWQPISVRCRENVVHGANYYTYCSGGDEKTKVAEISAKIKALKFRQFRVPGVNLQLLRNLTPVVFWKSRQAAKAKGVDIQLTVDILGNVYRNTLDVVYLVSGDGDYKPVIEEAKRHGKHVYIAALSDALNKDLPLIADDFIDLDTFYFKS